MAPIRAASPQQVFEVESGDDDADKAKMRRVAVFIVLMTLPWVIEAQTPLYWALANNDVGEVWRLTSEGVPLNLEENGMTAPGWAVERGNVEAIEALAWRGVPLDGVDDQGQNLLFRAVALGRLDLFDALRGQGARADQVDKNGVTLVHMASTSPHPEMLKALLAMGLGALEKTSLGVTPLMLACAAGRAEEVAVLLNWGAIPEDQDFLGRSVRDYALASGDLTTLAVLDEALTPWTTEPTDGAPPP